MRKHWRYLKYVVKHKVEVFKAARKLGVPWLGLLHDWSKLDPREFIPYADRFYGRGRRPDGTLYPEAWLRRAYPRLMAAYDRAWFLHLKRNRHHPDYWVCNTSPDPGKRPHRILPMPERYVREMVADWEGARRSGADGARSSTREWYEANGAGLPLHEDTRRRAEELLGLL